MKKDVNIGEKVVPMSASALTPFLYKKEFGRDLIKDVQTLQKETKKTGALDPEIVVMLTYIMAKEADKDLPPMEEWLSGFGLFDLYTAFNDVIQLWGLNEAQNSQPRKK